MSQKVNERVVIYGGVESWAGTPVSMIDFVSYLLSGRLVQTAAFGTLDILSLEPGEDPVKVLGEVAFTGRHGWACTGFYFSNGMFFVAGTRTVVKDGVTGTQAQFVLVDQKDETLLPRLSRKSTLV